MFLFISHARFGDRDPLDPSALDPAPELVVEILSPSDTKRVLDKEDRGLLLGRMCGNAGWSDMDLQTVEVLRLTQEGEEPVAVYAEGETAHSLAFPDLAVPVADIFAL